MISKTIFLTLATIVPALAQTQNDTSKLICVGEGGGYNHDGSRNELTMTYHVTIDGHNASIVQPRQSENVVVPDKGGYPFCSAGGICEVTVTDAQLEVILSKVPGNMPGYTAKFKLDRARATFSAGGSAYDGGWQVSGLCKTDMQ